MTAFAVETDTADHDSPRPLLARFQQQIGNSSCRANLEAAEMEQVNVLEWSFGSCPSPVYDIIDFIPNSPRDDSSEVSDCHSRTDSDHSTIPSNSRQSNVQGPLESEMCEESRQTKDGAKKSPKAADVQKSPKQLLSPKQSLPFSPCETKKSPSHLPPISPPKPESAVPSSRSEQPRSTGGGRRDAKPCPAVPPFVVLSPLTTTHTKKCPIGSSPSGPTVSDAQQLLKEHKERARTFMRKAASDGRLIRGPSPMTRTASTLSAAASQAGDLESRRRLSKAAEIKLESLARVPSKPLPEALERFGSAAASISRNDRTAASMLLKLQHTRARDYEAARPEADEEQASEPRMGVRVLRGAGGGAQAGTAAGPSGSSSNASDLHLQGQAASAGPGSKWPLSQQPKPGPKPGPFISTQRCPMPPRSARAPPRQRGGASAGSLRAGFTGAGLGVECS